MSRTLNNDKQGYPMGAGPVIPWRNGVMGIFPA